MIPYPLWGLHPNQLKVGLISCWEFNESSGTDLFDVYGGLDFTNVGCKVNQTGILDKAYNFDGTNDRCEYNTNNNDLSPQANHSTSMWFKRLGDSAADTGSSLLSKYYSSAGLRIYYRALYATTHATLDNQLRHSYWDTTNTSTDLYYDPGSDIWTDNWKHVVFTREGNSLKTYVNAVEVAGGTGGNGSMQQTTHSAVEDMIGAVSKSSTVPDTFFEGLIDQTASWNVALSRGQVSALYNNGSGLAYTSWNDVFF